jgi:DNA polymerase I-like protein with 3'-5' exonuclease and polymerase domains
MILRDDILCIDTETEILSPHRGSVASPFYKDNKIVYLGVSSVRCPTITTVSTDNPQSADIMMRGLFSAKYLVGHNIKFDLLYLRKHYPELYKEWYKAGGRVWDTMVVEYLLSGQDLTLPSLDKCSELYGLPVKDQKIKEYWKHGITTSKIPAGEIIPYLRQDVANTKNIFIAQQDKVLNNGMTNLVTTQMDCLLGLVEAEWNGMFLHREAATAQQKILENSRDKLEERLTFQMAARLPHGYKDTISPNSPKQVSLVLYGGKGKVIEHEKMLDEQGNPIVFKTGIRKGLVKTKKVIKEVEIAGMFSYVALSFAGKTDDSTLQKLINTSPVGSPSHIFLNQLIAYRRLQKEISTYYQQYIEYAWDDGFIHSNYNQALTDTGRLSSSGPNMQNASNKSIDDE